MKRMVTCLVIGVLAGCTINESNLGIWGDDKASPTPTPTPALAAAPPPQTREQFLDGLRQRIADSRIYFDDHNRIEGRFGVRMDVDREINKIIDEMCKWHGVSRGELMI